MKKILMLILAVLMLFGCFAACGAEPTPENNPAPAPGDTSDPAPDAAPEAASDPVKISFCNGNTAGSFNQMVCEEFVNYVEEISGGNITFTTYWGGTFCSSAEEYGNVTAGAIDMMAGLPVYYAANNPFVYNVNTYAGPDDCMALVNKYLVEDEACRAIIEKYSANDNVYVLGSQISGSSILISKVGFSTWDELREKNIKFGAGRDHDVYTTMGFNTVNVAPPDVYDSLSRGVADSYVYTAPNILTNKLYEVAPYSYNTYCYGNGQTWLVNLDVWNSLSAEQQEWMKAGMAHAEDYAMELSLKYEKELADVTTLVNAEESDAKEICILFEQAACRNLLEYAENLYGQEGLEDMIALTLVKEEWMGIEILPAEYASYRK